jgi:hypothetical protein
MQGERMAVRMGSRHANMGGFGAVGRTGAVGCSNGGFYWDAQCRGRPDPGFLEAVDVRDQLRENLRLRGQHLGRLMRILGWGLRRRKGWAVRGDRTGADGLKNVEIKSAASR